MLIQQLMALCRRGRCPLILSGKRAVLADGPLSFVVRRLVQGSRHHVIHQDLR